MQALPHGDPTSRRAVRRRKGKRPMNIVSAIVAPLAAYVGELERRRRYRNTERMIGALPAEVQKDIGWPGSARGADEVPAAGPQRPAAC